MKFSLNPRTVSGLQTLKLSSDFVCEEPKSEALHRSFREPKTEATSLIFGLFFSSTLEIFPLTLTILSSVGETVILVESNMYPRKTSL